MVDLPEPIPARIARLPRDKRGYPIPRFIDRRADGPADENGRSEPDFRFADATFRQNAYIKGLCWVCGGPLGRHRVFAVGPMCVVNRVTMEPPSHRDCAEWSAKACPFLTRPRMRRNDKGVDLEALIASGPGLGLARNPGAVALYETRGYKAKSDGKGGWLIGLGPPVRVDWVACGRPATRAEIEASIMSGLPLLRAADEGPEAEAELERMLADAMSLLPA